MKKVILLIAVIAIAVVSCKPPKGKAGSSADSTKVDTTVVVKADSTVVK